MEPAIIRVIVIIIFKSAALHSGIYQEKTQDPISAGNKPWEGGEETRS